MIGNEDTEQGSSLFDDWFRKRPVLTDPDCKKVADDKQAQDIATQVVQEAGSAVTGNEDTQQGSSMYADWLTTAGACSSKACHSFEKQRTQEESDDSEISVSSSEDSDGLEDIFSMRPWTRTFRRKNL